MKLVLDVTNTVEPFSRELFPSLFNSLKYNNSFIPGIERIVYSRGKKYNNISHRSYPTLTTIVFFKDGSKVSVQNSIHDKLNKRDIDCSKEIGLVYCLAKRLFGFPDEKGIIQSNGFSQKLKKFIKTSFDQNEAMEKAKKDKAERKAKYEAYIKNHKPHSHVSKPSLRKSVSLLNESIINLNNKINDLKTSTKKK